MADNRPESPQRWTAKRRAMLILSILKGETSAQAAARHARYFVLQLVEVYLTQRLFRQIVGRI